MARDGENIEGDPTLQGVESDQSVESDPTIKSDERTLGGDTTDSVDDELRFALDLVGRVFEEKYELKRLIGQGGMGAVYEAEHLDIGNKVAIKVLFPEKRRQRESIARFRREARAAGTIGHPNIAKVFDMGKSTEGYSFLVMEFVEGVSLAVIIAREKHIEQTRATAIAIAVLEALEAAHESGIVHRDIKPENVMVHQDSEGNDVVRVLDFGISKVRPMGTETQGLTQTGTVLGTPMYMAPEQARGETDMDHRIDLYAVGAMLYVMLSGQNPFQASNYNALLAKILTEDPPPLQTICPEIDEHLRLVVEKAMSRERENRFATARSFINALQGDTVEPLLEQESPKDEPVSSRKSPLLAIVGVILALGVVAIGGYLFLSSGDGGGEQSDGGNLEAERAQLGALASETGPTKTTSDAGPRADAHPSKQQIAEPEHIMVRITTEPDDARVYLNGRPVENPVEEELLQAEEETLVLRVEAPGFEDHEEIFPRTRDIEKRISLKRVVRRGKRGRRGANKRGNFRFDID